MISTTTLETSRKLKEAGFKQRTMFFWATYVASGRDAVLYHENPPHAYNILEAIAAPTSDEILAELPETIILKGKGFGGSIETKCVLVIGKVNGEWRISYRNQIVHISEQHESLPEALASMWLFLKQEGLIE